MLLTEMPHISLPSPIKVYTYRTAEGNESTPMTAGMPPVGTAMVDMIDVRIESYNASGLGKRVPFLNWYCPLPFNPGYLTAYGVKLDWMKMVESGQFTHAIDPKILCMFMLGMLGDDQTKAPVHPREGELRQEQIDYAKLRRTPQSVFEEELDSFLDDLSVDR